MFKNKKKLTLFTSTGLLLGSVILVCASTIAPVIAAHYNVIENEFFLYEDEVDGHIYTYKCYRFKDDFGNTVSGQVAIAWAEVPGNTPEHLPVPQTVRYDDTDYTVKAVAKHGFRYCDFETITLPNTIEQIEEEAFAYCTKLTTIGIPHLVDKIAPSTFLDCRALTSVKYLKGNGDIAFGNDTITEIGDHAFDSCVSLKDFYAPKNCTYFGESCFKNCRSLVNFYFPSEKKDDHDVTINPITVRSFAFADCKSLIFIYYETNMAEIDNYAFVDCHTDLHIKYNGYNIPSYSKDGVNQSHWRDQFIADNLTDPIPFDPEHPTIYSDDEYPCLRYTVENTPVKLDAAQSRDTQVYVIDQDEIDAEGEYAVIYKFDTPSETIEGCFTPSTGALIIPNKVNGKTVKIIEESAFANNSNIKSIKFNKDLVQICNRAFYNCLNIESLDFTSCEKLKEVSYWVFHDHTAGVSNSKVSSLILPDSLEYIGGYAFGEFYNVNELHLPSSLKAIDDLAFYRLGYSIKNANVNLVLPKSVNDADAVRANFQHVWKVNDKGDIFYHNDYTYTFAVGKYAFSEAKCILTFEMEEDPDHEGDNSYTTSFYSNVLNGSTNLIRFKASKNLQYFGKDAFKNCTGLREVFMTTEKSEASGCDYPWSIDEEQEDGLYGGSLFYGAVPEVVCYVDGAQAPGLLDSYELTVERTKKVQNNYYWNSETTNTASYTGEYKNANSIFTRNRVPTYYNVDFDSVVYWNPKTNQITTKPSTVNQYNAGVVSIVENSSNKYSIARYYYSGSNGTDIVDLTKIPGISDDNTHDLVEIGNSAFGRSGVLDDKNDNRNKQPGLYFILPDTITSIGERAFYRSTNGSKSANWNNMRYGARIVTYKNTTTGTYTLADGTTCSYSELSTIITTINGQEQKRGYCVLPSGVTYIGNAAFYNNIFATVRIGANVSYIGPGAFYSNPIVVSSVDYPRGVTTSLIVEGSNANFESSANGIYYIGSGASKKMLISQANGETGSLTLDSGTKAVGLAACANTYYSSIALNSGLTTIYGFGFAKNNQLTSVTGGTGLRYIGTMENMRNLNTGWDDADYTEVWDKTNTTMNEHISITDYRGYAYEPKQYVDSLQGAFFGCYNLETLDFTQLSEIRKIGFAAFSGCKKLTNLAGTNTYQYVSSNATEDPIVRKGTDSQNVLDLTNCHNLRSIGQDSFVECEKIKFIHLPNNIDSVKNESALYIGRDPENNNSTKGAIISSPSSITSATKSEYYRILVGNPAEYACPTNFGSGKFHNNRNHYDTNCFGTKSYIYYWAGNSGEHILKSGTSIHYWAQDNNGVYHLLWNEADAKAYFGIS